jgi:hypothetical protein
MFERYTESARRSVFFARYEASSFGSREIDSEHFVLALCRETALNQALRADAIRAAIQARTGIREKTPTSVDLPLTSELKRVLNRGAEIAGELNSREISCLHLALALHREADSPGGRLLRQHGVTEAKMHTLLGPGVKTALSLKERLDQLLSEALLALQAITPEQALQHTAGGAARAESLAHLIDFAFTHLRWISPQAVVEPQPPPGSWDESVDLWHSLNRQLLRELARAEPSWPVPKRHLVEHYIFRLGWFVKEIST